MMEAICKKCNRQFHYRNTKGNKLSYNTCECGGSYETLGGTHSLSGENPVRPEKTFESEYTKGRFYYAERTRSGKYFVAKDGFYIEIENPVKAESWCEVFIRELAENDKIELVKLSEEQLEYCTHTFYTWKEFKIKRTEYKAGLIQWHFREQTWIPEKIEMMLEEKCEQLKTKYYGASI